MHLGRRSSHRHLCLSEASLLFESATQKPLNTFKRYKWNLSCFPGSFSFMQHHNARLFVVLAAKMGCSAFHIVHIY